ncbi:MAG: SGNH/GDSL hydrolase family protein [Vulcanimicrobiaceae bacterium]
MRRVGGRAAGPLAGTFAALLAAAPAPAALAGVNMTVAGDSLALGIGATDSSRGFAFDLFERVRALRPMSEVTNLAIGGATTADVVRLELPRIAATRPTVVLLEVGANDVVRRHAAAAFGRDYRRLIDAVRRDAPAARIVILNVPDVSVSPIFEPLAKPPLRRLAATYNAIVAAEARRVDAPVVDLFAFSQRAATDPARYFSGDRFHPSDDGHAAIAAAAWPAVRAAIAPAVRPPSPGVRSERNRTRRAR